MSAQIPNIDRDRRDSWHQHYAGKSHEIHESPMESQESTHMILTNPRQN